MPSLLLLSRTPAYPVVRVGVAALGAALATAWLANRVGLISANPGEPVANVLVDHPLALALGLGVLALTLAVAPSVGKECHPTDRGHSEWAVNDGGAPHCSCLGRLAEPVVTLRSSWAVSIIVQLGESRGRAEWIARRTPTKCRRKVLA